MNFIYILCKITFDSSYLFKLGGFREIVDRLEKSRKRSVVSGRPSLYKSKILERRSNVDFPWAQVKLHCDGCS